MMYYYIVCVLFLLFVWCLRMAINKCTVEQWASPRHLTVDPMLLPSGNPFKCHEEVLSLQPTIPPKCFDTFPPDWGMLRRSTRVQNFLETARSLVFEEKSERVS